MDSFLGEHSRDKPSEFLTFNERSIVSEAPLNPHRAPLVGLFSCAARQCWEFVAWLLGALLASGLIWWSAEHQIGSKEAEARSVAMRQAESLANSYAAQLRHVAEQMDQLTLRIAHEWRDSPGLVDLERDQLRGVLPRRHGFFVYIINARGRAMRASFAAQDNVNVGQVGFFVSHRENCCLGLLITPPEYAPLVGRHVVRFSRRLDNRDGSFGGVIVISVEPDFLATFQDEALQGSNDFVSARLFSGPLLATRLGSGIAEKRVFYKNDPIFGAPRGIALEPGEKFRDLKPRYVSWLKLDDYPMVAVAGLSEQDALAPYRSLAYSYRITAGVATALLVLLALAGMILSRKLMLRRKAEESVRLTYRMATDAANEGFYMLLPLYDPAGQLYDFQVEDCNDRAAALLGMMRGHLVGARASSCMAPALHADILNICQRAMSHGVYEDEFRVPSGGWLRATWVYRRAVHSGTGIALTLRDISESKAHEQALSDLANNDALTKLPNRRWLMSFLPAAMRRAARGRGQLALSFIDLDNFKLVNDTLGHEAGDELLLQAAARIRSAVRASDHVVRLGGDEFTVVLEQMEDRADIARVADGIIAALSEPFSLSTGTDQRVSGSIGISVYPDHGEDAETLLKHADVAMYAAKSGGRGRHHFYEPRLSDALVLKMNREHALRAALDHDEFIVHYQPRVDARSGKLCSLEALLRWPHPERGLVLPSEFIGLAEDAGMIVRLGEIAIRKVVGQIAQWRDQGVRLVPVSVNISPRQLQLGKTAAFLSEVLEKHRVEPALVEVEVTETAVVDRSPLVSQELDALRAMGIRLMIDDFGTGYSSLAQLHRLDVDVLKVDQAFTHALSQGSEGELMYRAIVSMAAALDMRVVAEGVETVEQLKMLQAIGCHEIQGFIISGALPASDMAKLLARSILPPFDKIGRLVAVSN